MENFFRILAAILGGIAAYFLWTQNGEGAFVAVVLGAVSFFLSVRVQVKDRLTERDREILAMQDEEMRELENAQIQPDPASTKVAPTREISEDRSMK